MSERNYAQFVAGEVRAEMARQGLSLADLADAMNVSRETARLRYEGERAYDMVEIAVIAEWLGVPLRQLTLLSALSKDAA